MHHSWAFFYLFRLAKYIIPTCLVEPNIFMKFNHFDIIDHYKRKYPNSCSREYFGVRTLFLEKLLTTHYRNVT